MHLVHFLVCSCHGRAQHHFNHCFPQLWHEETEISKNFHQLFPSVGITPLHHNDSNCWLRLLWNSQITLVNYREGVSYTYWLLKSLVQAWIVYTQWIFFYHTKLVIIPLATLEWSTMLNVHTEKLYSIFLSRQRIEMQVKPAAFVPFKAYFICAVIRKLQTAKDLQTFVV